MPYENRILNYKSLYEENGVLKNKLNLTDKDALDMAERMITTKKLADLYLSPGAQNFDIKHYLSIHEYLFSDIYDFAGKTRNEPISKRIPFCLPQYIEESLSYTLKQFKRKVNAIDSSEKLIAEIAVLYSDLDVIHPFREGNGRTEREFIRQYIDFICEKNSLEPYYLNYSLIKSREEYIEAIVEADAQMKYDKLIALFSEILSIRKEEPKKVLKKIT